MARSRIAYAFVLIFCLAAAFLGASAPALAAAAVLALFAFIDFALCLFARRKLCYRTELRPSCARGEELSLELSFSAKLLNGFGGIVLALESNNLLTGTHKEARFRVASIQSQADTFAIAVNTDHCGRIETSCTSAYILGPLGICSLPYRIALDLSCDVLPSAEEKELVLGRTPQAVLSGANFDLARRGHDRSETFALRTYEEGDPLSSVHWKLSSKLDALTIREASRPSDYNVVLACDLGRSCSSGETVSERVLDDLLSITLSLSHGLLEKGISHDVVFYENDRLNSFHVNSIEASLVALRSAVATPAPNNQGNVARALEQQSDLSYTKAVFILGEFEAQSLRALSRRLDLTAICVGEGDAAAEIEAPGIAAFALPPGAFSETVRNVII